MAKSFTPIHDFSGFLSLMGLPTLPGKENQYLNPDNFNTPHRMIEFNLYWEWKAIEGYTKDRDKAIRLGDMKTAELFTHIRGEEEEHFDELLKRYNELVSNKAADLYHAVHFPSINTWPGDPGRSY